MGFSPQQVQRMSMWQYFAAMDGFMKANDPNAGKKLSEQEADELWGWIDG